MDLGGCVIVVVRWTVKENERLFIGSEAGRPAASQDLINQILPLAR